MTALKGPSLQRRRVAAAREQLAEIAKMRAFRPGVIIDHVQALAQVEEYITALEDALDERNQILAAAVPLLDERIQDHLIDTEADAGLVQTVREILQRVEALTSPMLPPSTCGGSCAEPGKSLPSR